MDLKLQRLYEQLLSGERSGDLFREETIASGYDSSFGNDLEQYAKADIDFLLDLTTYKPTDTVVDLGCGTGISTLMLLERKPNKIIGLDFSEPMLKQAEEKLRGRANVELKVGSAEELSGVVERADKVVSANVFQCFSNPDEVLQKVYGALNPNGESLFNVKLKAAKEQSIYFQLFRAIKKAMSETLDKEAKLLELKEPELKYDRTYLETLAARNGFAIARYEERQMIYDEVQLRAIHQQLSNELISELEKTLDQEATARIGLRLQYELTKMRLSGDFAAGKKAYVCLRKAQPISK